MFFTDQLLQKGERKENSPHGAPSLSLSSTCAFFLNIFIISLSPGIFKHKSILTYHLHLVQGISIRKIKTPSVEIFEDGCKQRLINLKCQEPKDAEESTETTIKNEEAATNAAQMCLS